MGHIDLQSRGGTLSGGKNNTFAFPEVKVMSVVQDANFVDSNWDDDDNVADLERNLGPKNTLKGRRITTPAATTTDASKKGQSPTSMNTNNKSNTSCSSSIKADENWLNDNFDD